jgi:hypothetical protein
VSAVGPVAVVDVTRPASLALALAALDTEDDSPVVVVHAPDDEHDVRVAGSVLVGHRPFVPVALVPSTHAPLAAIVALDSALRITTDAGHGAAVVGDLLSAAWSAVVTASVAGLDHPAPTVAQHVRSWWPGSRFVVRLGPRPRIVSAGRPLLALDGSSTSSRILHATSTAEEDLVTRTFAARTAARAARTITLPEGMPPPLELRDSDQLALLPSQPVEVVRRAGPPCPTCGLAASAAVCAFCRTRLPLRVQAGSRLLATAGSAA